MKQKQGTYSTWPLGGIKLHELSTKKLDIICTHVTSKASFYILYTEQHNREKCKCCMWNHNTYTHTQCQILLPTSQSKIMLCSETKTITSVTSTAWFPSETVVSLTPTDTHIQTHNSLSVRSLCYQFFWSCYVTEHANSMPLSLNVTPFMKKRNKSFYNRAHLTLQVSSKRDQTLKAARLMKLKLQRSKDRGKIESHVKHSKKMRAIVISSYKQLGSQCLGQGHLGSAQEVNWHLSGCWTWTGHPPVLKPSPYGLNYVNMLTFKS